MDEDIKAVIQSLVPYCDMKEQCYLQSLMEEVTKKENLVIGLTNALEMYLNKGETDEKIQIL